METGKKTLQYLKSSGYSNENTRVSYDKSLNHSNGKSLKNSLRFSQFLSSTDQKIQEILDKINFFNKPDIIPTPFNDLDPENFSSSLLAKGKSENTFASTKSSHIDKKNSKNKSGASSRRRLGNRKSGKLSSKSREGRGISGNSHGRGAVTSRSKSRGCDDDHGYYCDTCVRVHGHKWAMVRPS